MRNLILYFLFLQLIAIETHGQSKSAYFDSDKTFTELKYDSIINLEVEKLNQHLKDSFNVLTRNIDDEIRKHGTHYSEQKMKAIETDLLNFIDKAHEDLVQLREKRKLDVSNNLTNLFELFCATNKLIVIDKDAGLKCIDCQDLTSDFIKFIKGANN